MRSVVFVVIMLLVFGGAVCGILYFDNISPKGNITSKPMDLSTLGLGESTFQSDEFIDTLAIQNDAPYVYPATELHVKFDFVQKGKEPKHPSAISINELDEYKFACVKQVLAQNHIESAYYKSGDTLKLVVFINDEKTYQKLLEDLAYYRLNYTIQ